MKSRLIITAIVLILAMTFTSVALAAPPGTTIPVSGDWSWVNTNYTETTLAGNHVGSGDEIGTWTGTFKGSSYDVFEMTFAPPFEENDFGAVWGTLTAVFTGKVNGKQGSMTMYFTIRIEPNGSVMTGTWRILSGTEGLKFATGSGTWVSNDVGATYEGTVSLKSQH